MNFSSANSGSDSELITKKSL